MLNKVNKREEKKEVEMEAEEKDEEKVQREYFPSSERKETDNMHL